MVTRKPNAAKRGRCTRFRVGRVSVYFHHSCWWLYYRQVDQPVRKRIGTDRTTAERVASEINAQLTVSAQTMFDFRPVVVTELHSMFLAYHEDVLRSSLGTIGRYRSSIQHLVNYANSLPRQPKAHEVSAAGFVEYLRACCVSPNGHPNTAKRQFRDKGVQNILENCRSMYGFAQRQRHLPPYATNPFAELRIERMRVEDAKPIFVFDADTELRFFGAAKPWEFPIHFTQAKTGLRSGELCHVLIEEIDLRAGWLHVRNKPELGWSVKTRNERSVPLHPILLAVLRQVIGNRVAGVVFRRPMFAGFPAACEIDRSGLRDALAELTSEVSKNSGVPLTRKAKQQLSRQLWRDAGAFDSDQIRRSFIRIATRCGLPYATCPKSWRHSFATLLQDANVDPLLRQITLGHQPSGTSGALGMTSVYTHSRPETHAREIARAISQYPRSLELAQHWLSSVDEFDTQSSSKGETDSKRFPSNESGD
ncbi:tyrosine-type recombinase/integrase [Schlesneria paludicola]|uniref:tyrosine-type recombinase/integrase n=1 Tax=Schlesneria paludicola TaxID=360056 RepID=UPI000299CFDD|nr:site-specific integrase [Schlesneria paludicola]